MRKNELAEIEEDVKEIISFEEGKFRPLFVSSKDIEKVVIGYSKKTAANDRSRKVGPKFFMVGGTPYYRIADLEDYFTQCPVETFNPMDGNEYK